MTELNEISARADKIDPRIQCPVNGEPCPSLERLYGMYHDNQETMLSGEEPALLFTRASRAFREGIGRSCDGTQLETEHCDAHAEFRQKKLGPAFIRVAKRLFGVEASS